MQENTIYNRWVDLDIFNRTIEANKDKPTFVFYDGPPFATGLPHYGHILAGFIKDSILRFNHEQGWNVPRFAGFDQHGLPIEYEIEKELGIKTTQQVLDYGIDNYNRECKGIVLKYAHEWEETMGRLGRWIDFKNQYQTMSKEFMNSVWWVFAQLYKKNRVYEGVRIMPYSTACGTPLSNFETQQNYKEVQDDSLFIKLPINLPNFQNTWIMIWTTTPWTLPSNYALCVGPDIIYDLVQIESESESDYYIVAHDLVSNVFKNSNTVWIKSFKGLELVGICYTPAFTLNNQMENIPYKIVADPFVTSTDGTGIVHLAPGFGSDDYNVSLTNKIITKESKLFIHLDTNGYIKKELSDQIPELTGMFYKNFQDKSVLDFNTWVIIQLKKSGYYWDKRQITHNYPFCWRSDTPLIYRAVSSWFIKVEDMREKLVQLNNQINWVPEHVGKARFSSWLTGAKDWGVSRNRFWGTPIPIWRSIEDPTDIICVGSSYELEELAGLEPNSLIDLHRDSVDSIEIVKDGKVYRRISEILDCWFESGSMPYGSVNRVGIVELLRNSIKGIELDENFNPFIRTRDNFLHKILPADFIAEGLDQTRGWFYTLLVLSGSLFDTIPFKNVIVNGLVLASDGKKMSKRYKNYPDPMEVVNTYGSDCLRLYLLGSPASKAEPLKFSEQGVRDMGKDIIIPLSNSFVFFCEYTNLYWKSNNKNPLFQIENFPERITNPINIWAIIKYKTISENFQSHMKNYDLNRAVNGLDELVQMLNNGYIKLSRQLIKGKETELEQIQSLSTLYWILKQITIDFRSIIPYFCENQFMGLKEFIKKIEFCEENGFFELESIHLYSGLNSKSIGLNLEQIAKSKDFDIIFNIINQIYQLRGVNQINLKKPIKSVSLVTMTDFDKKYSTGYQDLLNFVLEECNIMELKILNQNEIIIEKSISPNKVVLFKTYGKPIGLVYGELSNFDSDKLDGIIGLGMYKDFLMDKTMFNIKTTIKFIKGNENVQGSDKTNSNSNTNIVYREYKFDGYEIKLIANLDWDESTDKLYYYRLVGTKIQKTRKSAQLHPWDLINVYYSGNPKYSLESDDAQDIIYKITRINISKFSNEFEITNKSCFFEQDFDDINLRIHLEKSN